MCLSYIDGFCIPILRYGKGKVKEVCSFEDAVASVYVISAHCNLNRKWTDFTESNRTVKTN